jgi:hypothetical protein
MTKYFENFPTIEYNGRRVKDITRRNNFSRNITNNPYLFMPYTVRQGERPEDIAQFYYGSTDYTWLVYLANNIVDPYLEWPLDDYNFNQYLIKKYQSQSGKTGEDVVDWTRDQSISDNILYYYREV